MGVAFRALLRKPPDAIPEEQVRAAVQTAGDAWRILDARLADRPFVAGAALTMGDIALGNAVHRWFKLPVSRPELAHVKRWYERLRERPAYAEHIASI
jgi:glutathione S-transferase